MFSFSHLVLRSSPNRLDEISVSSIMSRWSFNTERPGPRRSLLVRFLSLVLHELDHEIFELTWFTTRRRVNLFGRAFSQLTVSDLLLINPEGEAMMRGKPDRQVYNEVHVRISGRRFLLI